MSKCSHNMRRFIYLAFLLLAACSPKPTETNGSGGTSNRPQTIIGNCRWIRSSGGFAGETIYPKAEELQTYQFTSDSTAYYLHLYLDIIHSWNSKFSLRDQRSFITGTLAPFLHFQDTTHNGMIQQSVWLHGSDTLELVDEVADGYSYLYVRQDSTLIEH